jgi:hypothetical protein
MMTHIMEQFIVCEAPKVYQFIHTCKSILIPEERIEPLIPLFELNDCFNASIVVDGNFSEESKQWNVLKKAIYITCMRLIIEVHNSVNFE